MNTFTLTAVALGAALLAASAGQAQNENGGAPLSAKLTGAAERPGPGDPDGSGAFEARLNPGTGMLCYTLTVKDIDTAVAAHIHEAGPDAPGPVRVTLETPFSGRSQACTSIDPTRAKAIVQNPGDYYVNVHNPTFGPGAVRGQLGRMHTK